MLGEKKYLETLQRHAKISKIVADRYASGESSTNVMKEYKIGFREFKKCLSENGVVARCSSDWRIGWRTPEDVRRKQSDSRKKLVMEGKLFSVETRRKMSESNLRFRRENPDFVRREMEWTAERREAARRRAIGNKNKSGRCESPMFRRNVSVAMRKMLDSGGVTGFCGKNHSQLTKRLMQKRKCQWIVKNHDRMAELGRADTDIELIVKDQLDKNGVKYVHPYSLKDIRVAEFYIPEMKLVIECDGEWWHLLPGKEQRDVEETDLVEALGKKLLRIPGEKILRSDFNVMDELSKIVVLEVCNG